MLGVLEAQNQGNLPGSIEPSTPPPCITSLRTHTAMTSPPVINSSLKPRAYNVAVE